MYSDLDRFLTVQEDNYNMAFSEIRSGRKRSHWMWYIFPQLKGLGVSETSKYYAIKDMEEAVAYLNHPTLGTRLKEISNELLTLKTANASLIFGNPDDLKLQSCMTLFAQIEAPDANVFAQVIDKFFEGNYDGKTLDLLNQ